jgi:integration host factor subunit alpha
LNKTDIVKRISEGSRFTRQESMELVESLLEIVKEALSNSETLLITGFGSFLVNEKNDRKGRNPKTGEPVTIEARRVVRFKASALLKRAMNR